MKKDKRFWIVNLILLFVAQTMAAQVDSLYFKSGEFMIGEIKSMDKGILKVETDYSDSDFKIEWDKLIGIRTTTQFMITLSDGRKYYGTMKSASDTTIQFSTKYATELVISNEQIVSLIPFDDKFLDRLSADISLGVDLAKAQNLFSFTTRSSLGYRAEKWDTDVSFYSLRSSQDSVETIKRTEAVLNFRYVLPRQFYAIATVSGLSNTEQKLDLRLNTQLGLGNFLVRTGSMYWGAKLGVNRNLEHYSNETEDHASWEGFLGTEVNLFDMGDVSMLFLIVVYPSITDPGRLRTDSKLDFKYDLPLDFYINLGASLNSDNRPAADAGKIDYVLYTGFGWEW
jgi:hypothetical protein